MRKFIPYLLFLYLLILVSVVAYSRLTPAPPPPPPSRWSIFWREHGDIVAAGLILMLTLMELAIGVFVLGGVLVLLKKGWTIWAHSVGRSGGLAPVIRDKRGEWLDVNPEGAVIAAAIAAHAPKVTAAMTRNMMDSVIGAGRWSVQDVPFEEPVDASYQVVEEFRPDMVDATGQDAQHHLFVGPTGSGKSVAAFSVLDQMKQQQPEADFYIFEPGGVEWKAQAAATTFEGLFDLVKHFHDEMRRRQQMLAAHPQAVHAFEIGLPPVVLFIEEAGAALDYYKLSPGGKKLSQEFSLYLRNLLREARKTGIGVTLVTQSAMAETFDTQVLDNITHVWLLSKGASPKLLRRWSLTDEFRRLKQAGLLADRPGLAYDYHARRLVQFPKRDRPVLMLEPPKIERIVDATPRASGGASSAFFRASSATPRASDALLNADPGAISALQARENRKMGDFGPNSRSALRSASSRGASAGFNSENYVRRLAQRNEREGSSAVISYRAAMMVHRMYQEAGSYRALQRNLWPEHSSSGGHRFYWLRDVVEQMEGQPRTRPTVTVIFSDKKRSAQKSDAQS